MCSKTLAASAPWRFMGWKAWMRISLCGPTKVAELRDGQVKEYTIEPEPLELKKCRLEDLRGGNAEASAEIDRGVLRGDKRPARDVVVLNSGAALYVSGTPATIAEG